MNGEAVGIGWWLPGATAPDASCEGWRRALRALDEPVYAVVAGNGAAAARGGEARLGGDGSRPRGALPLLGIAPPLPPEQLGDAAFRRAHGVRFAYVAGEMANGIGSEAMVEAMARAGMLGFFGAAGLSPARVEAAIDRIHRSVGDRRCGFNLIHSPSEPELEAAVADLYLRRGVRLVSASAYLDLTAPLVRYRVSGLRRGPDGRVVAPHRVMAKVSRVEVARKFLAPPPPRLVAALLEQGAISRSEAELAGYVPMADDLTAEADSGGHTDNRPLVTLLPALLALRDQAHGESSFAEPPRVGAAGGIATPESVAAAFAMGAAYVLTGSINQACVEAGTSEAVKQMLARAGPADVTMAPAADMFEMGVRVQVLKWGTMFAVRAQKLYELYRACDSLDAIPPAARAALERDYFRCSLEQAWEQTRQFFAARDPRQIERAAADPKHQMALVFRKYLGESSKWAISGDASRRADYQVWCGPAMGAFNEWVRGTFLEQPPQRGVVTIARNLMWGAAVLTRAAWLRAQHIALPSAAQRVAPIEPSALGELGG